MTLQVINRGSSQGDPTAESVYAAFGKTIDNFAELYGLYGSETEAFTFTTKQNNLAIAAYTRIARWNGAGSTGITGIAAPSVARVVTIINASTDYLLWLENENTASTAANRLMLPDSFPAFLMPGDTITLVYDGTAARWRVLSWPTRGQGMGFSFVEDGELDAALTSNTPGGTGASVSLVATGIDATNRAMGVYQFQTGTTSTGRVFKSPTSSANSSIAPTLGAALYGARIHITTAPTAAETFSIYTGFHDGYGGTLVDGVMWEHRWNGSAAELGSLVSAASATARSVTNSPGFVAGAFNDYIVFVNPSWTRADFIYSTDSIKYSLMHSVSSGLPTVTGLVSPSTGIQKSNGSTAGVMAIDWIGVRIAQVRA